MGMQGGWGRKWKMRESKTNAGRARRETSDFELPAQRRQSSAILAKFYDVCSRDVQSPRENASFHPSRSIWWQSDVAMSPMGLRTGLKDKGRRGLRWHWGRTARGSTARETYANLKILRHILCGQVRNGWTSSLVISLNKTVLNP